MILETVSTHAMMLCIQVSQKILVTRPDIVIVFKTDIHR